MTLEDKLQRLLDIEDIKTLMSKYCHGIDKKDEPTFMSIWAEDGDYLLPRGEGHGIDGIRQLVQKVWREVPQCHHHITNPVIEVKGDEAVAKTDVTYFRLTSDGIHQLLSGGYDFSFTRTGDGWKVRSLKFNSFISASPIFKDNIRG